VNLSNGVARMPAPVKVRLVLITSLAALLALLAVGCGGGSDSGGGSDPAGVAPAKAPVFVDFTIHPEGETKQNIEALAKEIAGVDDLGGLIVAELEKSAAEDGEEVDFEKEVEPWLGERAGVFFEEFSEGDSKRFGLAIQTTDEDASREFIKKQSEQEDGEPKSSSYNDVDFTITADEEEAVGVFDGLLVIAEDESVFKEMVDASEGEPLADAQTYSDATSEVPADSAANVFVDIGAVLKESGNEIDPAARKLFETAGVKPEEATAVASVVPGSDNVEIDLTSNLTDEGAPAGEAPAMLESLPADSVVALAGADLGDRLREAIDQIDEEGIEGEVPPHQLKDGLKQSGFDLEELTASLGDVGVFVTGSSERDLGGAVVIETDGSSQVTNTISSLGLLVRASGTPGVTALSGKVKGFSVRDEDELGPQPVVVATANDRVAIGYGLRATTTALQGSGETLGASSAFKEAKDALGGTPMGGFVDGPAALRLVEGLIPTGEEAEFDEAKPYLEKISYVAIGGEPSGDLAKAKLIVGVGSK
jgi:Protein of unknown function (DUF3352)